MSVAVGGSRQTSLSYIGAVQLFLSISCKIGHTIGAVQLFSSISCKIGHTCDGKLVTSPDNSLFLTTNLVHSYQLSSSICRADVLEWFTTMTRSKTTREGEYTDLSIHLEEEIGPTPGYTLDIINDTGKTNEVSGF